MLKQRGYKGKYLGWYFLDYDGYTEVSQALQLPIGEITDIVEVSALRYFLSRIVARVHYKLFYLKYPKN